MPVHDAEPDVLLLQGDIPCCVRRIVLTPFDPRKPCR
jgi:hypothetical protein